MSIGGKEGGFRKIAETLTIEHAWWASSLVLCSNIKQHNNKCS